MGAPKEIGVIRRAYELGSRLASRQVKTTNFTIRQRRNCNGGSTKRTSPARNSEPGIMHQYPLTPAAVPIGSAGNREQLLENRWIHTEEALVFSGK
jgi:hypothetical protein